MKQHKQGIGGKDIATLRELWSQANLIQRMAIAREDITTNQ